MKKMNKNVCIKNRSELFKSVRNFDSGKKLMSNLLEEKSQRLETFQIRELAKESFFPIQALRLRKAGKSEPQNLALMLLIKVMEGKKQDGPNLFLLNQSKNQSSTSVIPSHCDQMNLSKKSPKM
jgi:hypothetical protein